MKKQTTFKTRVLYMATLLGMAVALSSCSSDEIAQSDGGKTTETETDKNLTTFVSDGTGGDGTRTTMSNTGTFKWQAGDKIWVKDDNNTWQQSSNAPTSEAASFRFRVPGSFTAGGSYTIYYPGKNGSQNQVTISSSQSQTAPDNPAHVGDCGDCGWATASDPANKKVFNFTLNHKAAFLVFSPYCSNNTVLNSSSVKLTKIEVTSDNDLVGTYTLDPATNQLTGSGSGKQINLTTKGTGGSATENGFSVPTAATPATNASYVVIKPGTHTLKVRFWLKDYVTNIEGTVTKLYPSFAYAANTYYSMSSELKVKDYPGNNYYMWDAQQQYWYGHEWNKAGYVAGIDQPAVNGQGGSAYPQSNADSRWCNEIFPGAGIQYDAATSLFQTLPNANELSWYCMKGDPRWDDDELWTTMGHLYKGGMWFKKAAKIATDNGITTAYMKTKAADNSTDLRTTGQLIGNSPTNISSNPISAADQADYFYLPALGEYRLSTLFDVGDRGAYWSSSASPRYSIGAYTLNIGTGYVTVSDNSSRENIFSVVPFE